MSEFLLNLGVVIVFTLIGGFFAAAEIALVSLRESQVQRLAEDRGKKGERLARLVHDPNRFLAAVQLAVTTAAFLSAGFGASQMSPQVSPLLVRLGLSQVELTRLTGKSLSTVRLAEAGIATRSTLATIAAALGVSVDELTGRKPTATVAR